MKNLEGRRVKLDSEYTKLEGTVKLTSPSTFKVLWDDGNFSLDTTIESYTGKKGEDNWILLPDKSLEFQTLYDKLCK